MTAARIAGVECSTAGYRDALSDDEFWPYVLQGIRPGQEMDEPDYDPDVPTTNQNDPCPECGEYGACAYDAEGRAMTHVITRDDDDERLPYITNPEESDHDND